MNPKHTLKQRIITDIRYVRTFEDLHTNLKKWERTLRLLHITKKEISNGKNKVSKV